MNGVNNVYGRAENEATVNCMKHDADRNLCNTRI